MTDKFIAYYRVSTDSQGIRGLGMEAQKQAVLKFLNGRQPDYEFSEVESGKQRHRPQLDRALACCHKTQGTLLIAKLDRLARNAAFLLNLRDSGVNFICCDMPNADKFTIGILALVAERERDMTSERTKAALAAAKARGVKLGNPNLLRVRAKGIAARQQKALAFAANFKPLLAKMEKAGLTTLQEIADALNLRGYRTPRGKEFQHQSVKNLRARL